MLVLLSLMGWEELTVALSVEYTGAGGLRAKWTPQDAHSRRPEESYYRKISVVERNQG